MAHGSAGPLSFPHLLVRIMITPKQRATLAEMNAAFVQSIKIASEATPEDVRHSGWERRGRLAWIEAIIDDYNAELHNLMGD